MTSMLETAGETGYRNVSVQDVIERCGSNRVQFYRHFASKDDCFATAYEDEIERVSGALIEAAQGEPGWLPGLRAALGALAGYIESRPLVARGVAVEVHVAGGEAVASRARAYERATRAIDQGRRQSASDVAPPPVTAAFLLGAIESTLTGALMRDEPQAFAAAIPELTHMIASTYLGEDAAAGDVAAPSAV
jgi:AcrR family transcriptional regulator